MNRQVLTTDDINTTPGIMAQLILYGLAGLNNVVRTRMERGYRCQNRETFENFVVMGRWLMTSDGGTQRFERDGKVGFIPADISNLPMVMTNHDFWALVAKVKGTGVRSALSYHDHIPMATATCPWCNLRWDLDNSHDVYENGNDVEFPIPFWTGKTLASVVAELQKDRDEVFRFHNEMLLSHPRWIDLAPLHESEVLVVNESGLVGVEGDRGVKISWDYQIQEGDVLHTFRCRFFHSACWREYQDKKEQAAFTAIFLKAGFQQIKLTATENLYCDCESCAPWYFVDTEIGRFQIGWRKRVISISWENLHEYNPELGPFFMEFLQGQEKLRSKLLSLFTAEDVTKDEKGIHAYGDQKAIEYLRKIRECLV